MPKKATKKTKVEQPSDDVTVCLKLGANEYRSTASSISKALNEIRPDKITLRGLFTIIGKGLSYETQMFPQQLKRLLFGSDVGRLLFEKKAMINKKYF